MAKEALGKKHTEVDSTSYQTWKIPIVILDKEWEQFNQNLQTGTSLEETSQF